MRRVFEGRCGMALAFVLGLVIATAGTATAARLITGKQIRDGSISAKDLSRAVRAQLRKAGVRGLQGIPGTPGTQGSQGTKGDQGPAGTPDGYTRAQADATFVPTSRFLRSTADTAATTRQTVFDFPDLGLTMKTDGVAGVDLNLCFTSTRGLVVNGVASGTIGVPTGAGLNPGLGGSAGTAGCATPAPAASQVDWWVWTSGGDPFSDPLTPVLRITCSVPSLSGLVTDRRMVCIATRL